MQEAKAYVYIPDTHTQHFNRFCNEHKYTVLNAPIRKLCTLSKFTVFCAWITTNKYYHLQFKTAVLVNG